MENDVLLFTKNRSGIEKRLSAYKDRVVIPVGKEHIGGDTIKYILKMIYSSRIKYGNKVIVIKFLKEPEFVDKLTYIFLEIICYVMLKEYNQYIFIEANWRLNIYTEGFRLSPLGEYGSPNFEKFYSKRIYKNHYREIIKKSEKSIQLSVIMTDIGTFLTTCGLGNKEYSNKISEVVVELIGNAFEHASNECLLDIDITDSTYIEQKTGKEGFIGINIALVNFSESLFGSKVKNRMNNGNSYDQADRYYLLKKAYENHLGYFSNDPMEYQEEDFYNIASFQHKISGAMNKIGTGGVGLTRLIESLENYANSHTCYMMSGNRSVFFQSGYLDFNIDKWIGFNNEKDFLNYPPDVSSIGVVPIYMPGTAYNLNFVMEGA